MYLQCPYDTSLILQEKILSYNRQGQKISSDIREQMGIYNINDKLTQYKMHWRERIQRMDETTDYPKKKIKLQN